MYESFYFTGFNFLVSAELSLSVTQNCWWVSQWSCCLFLFVCSWLFFPCLTSGCLLFKCKKTAVLQQKTVYISQFQWWELFSSHAILCLFQEPLHILSLACTRLLPLLAYPVFFLSVWLDLHLHCTSLQSVQTCDLKVNGLSLYITLIPRKVPVKPLKRSCLDSQIVPRLDSLLW